MSNQNPTNEYQAALALDEMLTELQQGKAHASKDNTTLFSQQLVSLAENTRPQAGFEERLRATLLAQAQKKQTQKKSLFHQIDEGIRSLLMKRLLLTAAGLTAVLAIAFVSWNIFRSQPVGTEPLAGIPGLGSQTTEEVVEQDLPAGDAVAEAAVDSAIHSRGVGGGGFGFGEGHGPFTDATIGLNATLPTESEAAVFAGPFQNNNEMDLEQLRRFAEQMGVSGDVYFEWYPGIPEDGRDDGSGNRPYNYRIFDGQQMVSGFPNVEFFYENSALMRNQSNLQPLPFDERVVIAEQFLQERGLLDFEYEIHPSWGNEVQFLPKFNGAPVYNWAQIYVNVSGDGQIMTVSKRPLSNLTETQVETLRTADEAWSHVQQNFNNGPLIYNIIPANPEFYGTPFPSGQKTHWELEFAPGQEVTINSWIQIFRPADGSITPRLVTGYGMVLVSDDTALLEEIAEAAAQGNNIRLQGTVTGEPARLQLEVASWETLVGPSDIYLTGTTREQNGVIVLELPGGFPVQIANPPADLPLDTVISMSSWGVRVADDGVSAITDWVTLDLAYVSPPAEEESIIDPFSNISNVTIDRVDLAYFYLYPEEPFPFTSTPVNKNGEAHMVPVWRFVGSTNNGDFVEIVVPALTSIELPEPAGE